MCNSESSKVNRTVEHYDVLGTRIAALTLDRTVSLLEEQTRQRRKGYVCICTVNEIVESMRDPSIRRTINAAWLATADGMPLVWWGRAVAKEPVERVYGPDLLRRVLTDPSHRDTRHYFYGGTTEEITRRVVDAARRLNPDVRIAGWSTPPFGRLSPEQEAETTRQINDAKPDIVWVGLGGRKQTLWISRFRPTLSASILVGVGAAFDFLAGIKAQAPVWVRRAGLEWLFRLFCEPRRLWRRYLVHNTIFVACTLAYVTGLSRLTSRRALDRG